MQKKKRIINPRKFKFSNFSVFQQQPPVAIMRAWYTYYFIRVYMYRTCTMYRFKMENILVDMVLYSYNAALTRYHYSLCWPEFSWTRPQIVSDNQPALRYGVYIRVDIQPIVHPSVWGWGPIWRWLNIFTLNIIMIITCTLLNTTNIFTRKKSLSFFLFWFDAFSHFYYVKTERKRERLYMCICDRLSLDPNMGIIYIYLFHCSRSSIVKSISIDALADTTVVTGRQTYHRWHISQWNFFLIEKKEK